jgi:hypothetical protein
MLLSHPDQLARGAPYGDDDTEADEAYLGEQQGRLRNQQMPPTQNYGRAPWPIRSYESVANRRNIVEDASLLMSDAAKEDMRYNIADTALFDDPPLMGERSKRNWPALARRRVPRINNPNMARAPTTMVVSDFTLEVPVQPPLPDKPITDGAYAYRAKSKLVNVWSQQVVSADYEQS